MRRRPDQGSAAAGRGPGCVEVSPAAAALMRARPLARGARPGPARLLLAIRNDAIRGAFLHAVAVPPRTQACLRLVGGVPRSVSAGAVCPRQDRAAEPGAGGAGRGQPGAFRCAALLGALAAIRKCRRVPRGAAKAAPGGCVGRLAIASVAPPVSEYLGSATGLDDRRKPHLPSRCLSARAFRSPCRNRLARRRVRIIMISGADSEVRCAQSPRVSGADPRILCA